MYLIRDLETNLVEGYYAGFDEAEGYLKRIQRKFKDRSFTIDFEDHQVTLKDNDMIKYSEWYNNRRKNA